jgi:hypothetical protein
VADLLIDELKRAMTIRADIALLSEAGPTAPAITPPPGLLVQDHTTGGAIVENLDALSDAVAQIEAHSGTADLIVASPAGWAAVSKLKTGEARDCRFLVMTSRKPRARCTPGFAQHSGWRRSHWVRTALKFSHTSWSTILRDTRFRIPPGTHLLVQGISSGPLWDKVVNSLLCMEGAEHHRLRRLVSKAFTPRATARLHDTIVDVVNELVDRVADAGRCNVVSDIARPYPIPIICASLGAPREDWQQFSLWADDIFKAFSFNFNLADEEAVVMRAWGELDDYVDDMVAQRRDRLTDDLLSALIRAEDDGERLNADELRMLAAGLLMTGTDTTRNQLAASVHVVCDHLDQWAVLGENPELAMRAVDESMRHSPRVRRRAHCDRGRRVCRLHLP